MLFSLILSTHPHTHTHTYTHIIYIYIYIVLFVNISAAIRCLVLKVKNWIIVQESNVISAIEKRQIYKLPPSTLVVSSFGGSVCPATLHLNRNGFK